MKIFLIVLGIALLLMFVPPIFEGILNFGNGAGILAGLCLLALGIIWNSLFAAMKIICAFAVSVLIVSVILLLVPIIKAQKTTARGQKLVIVLGCKVKGDKPSLALEKRVKSAGDFLNENPDAVAILSGGKGRDEDITEALCMKQLLVKQGIDEKRLVLEEKSTSTDENIRFSMEIAKKMGIKKEAAIATSEYHQYRAGKICEKYGIKAYSLASGTRFDLLPTFLLRELFAIIKLKLFK